MTIVYRNTCHIPEVHGKMSLQVLLDMFSSMDAETVQIVWENNKNDFDLTVEQLLALSSATTQDNHHIDDNNTHSNHENHQNNDKEVATIENNDDTDEGDDDELLLSRKKRKRYQSALEGASKKGTTTTTNNHNTFMHNSTQDTNKINNQLDNGASSNASIVVEAEVNNKGTTVNGTCPVCMDESDALHELQNCGHCYCLECLHHYLQQKIKDKQVPIKVNC